MLKFQKNKLDSAKEEELEIITNLRVLVEKAQEHQQPLYVCFVDFKKAIDSVPHDALWITIMDIGFRAHMVRQKAKVKTAGVVSGWLSVMKGAQQGCVLSPHLLNVLLKAVMKETIDGYTGGLRIGGRTVAILRYADDIVLIATSQSDLQQLVDRLDPASQKYGLEITCNIDKTKIMATQDNIINNITINGIPVAKV